MEFESIVKEIKGTVPSTWDPEFKNPSWIDANGQRQCLPYFYILGMPKCATTDLFHRLQMHSHIKCGQDQQKEPYFWTRGRHFLRNGSTIDDYIANFKQFANNMQSEHITGDASVQTFWENKQGVHIPDLLYAIQPDAKLIVILRDPVERAHSEYRYIYRYASTNALDSMLTKNLDKVIYNGDFEKQALWTNDPILKGLYYIYLKEWLARYPAQQLLILSYTEYVNSPKVAFNRVFKFLEIPEPDCHTWDAILKNGIVKNQSINQCQLGPIVKENLAGFYWPFNKFFQIMLARYKGPSSDKSTFLY